MRRDSRIVRAPLAGAVVVLAAALNELGANHAVAHGTLAIGALASSRWCSAAARTFGPGARPPWRSPPCHELAAPSQWRAPPVQLLRHVRSPSQGCGRKGKHRAQQPLQRRR